MLVTPQCACEETVERQVDNHVIHGAKGPCQKANVVEFLDHTWEVSRPIDKLTLRLSHITADSMCHHSQH